MENRAAAVAQDALASEPNRAENLDWTSVENSSKGSDAISSARVTGAGILGRRPLSFSPKWTASATKVAEVVADRCECVAEHILAAQSGLIRPDETALITPQLERNLTVFGSAVAITLIHGDPFGVLLHLFGLNKTDNFYFNSVSVRAGFCLVVNCIVFDELFDKFELSEMIQLVRESHVLARTSIA